MASYREQELAQLKHILFVPYTARGSMLGSSMHSCRGLKLI